MTDQAADIDARATSEWTLPAHLRTVDQQAADVTKQRLAQAQAAREKRGAGIPIETGIQVPFSDNAATVRHGISASTRQARKQRGQELGAELSRARWLAQQQGGR
jgi:hypothetical protein